MTLWICSKLEAGSVMTTVAARQPPANRGPWSVGKREGLKLGSLACERDRHLQTDYLSATNLATGEEMRFVYFIGGLSTAA